MFSPEVLKEMWQRAWPIISLLLAGSVFSGAIILERWLHLRRADFDRATLLEKLRKLLSENRREQAIAQCESMNRPVGRVIGGVLEASMRTADGERLQRLADRLIRGEAADMHQYITGLGTIGSIAPFVGLLGTVIGIIHAFRAISENTGGGPGVIAHGISEALVTTALGLFVAIPAVAAYNMFTRKVERINEDMSLCAEEVLDLVGARKA